MDRETTGFEAKRVADAVAAWCAERPVRLCVLFGSRATSAARADSDVDLAVWPLSDEPAADERRAWSEELARRLDLPVQLVLVTPRLDPVLGIEIARHGRVIHAARPESWAEERLRLWHLYQDSRPFLAAARDRLRRFTEGAAGGA